MNGNLVDVFNTYNVNILFTVAALPARVSVGGPLGAPPGSGGNANLIMSPSTHPPVTPPHGGQPAQPGFAMTAQRAGAANLPPVIQKTYIDEEEASEEQPMVKAVNPSASKKTK